MEMPCEISSGVNMVSAVPSAAEPWRLEAPEVWQQASISVGLPLPPWPTTTTLRVRAVVKLGADAMCTSWDGGMRMEAPARGSKVNLPRRPGGVKGEPPRSAPLVSPARSPHIPGGGRSLSSVHRLVAKTCEPEV